MAKKTTRGSRGFTLTEMLVTVAIVIVLFALAMIPISKMQRDMRQTELDSRAEMLFMAAQNRLTQLQAAGRSGAYQAGARELGCIPVDAKAEQYKEENNLCYVTSDEKETAGSAAANIMPQDKTDAELWNANWVIEYDKVSGSVYAVFYSQKPLSDYSPDGDFGALRYRENRLNAGAKVGYYGGDSVGVNKTGELAPTVELINAEQLAVKITCEMPGDKPLRFFVTVADEDGHKTDEIELKNGIDTVTQDYRTFTAEMLLDDLTEGKEMRFYEQPRFFGLVPGEDLTITVRVSASDPLIEDSIDIVKANSLFAKVEDNGEGRTATIEYARHLQNLDKASGVEKLDGEKIITAAVQVQDIQFREAGKSEDQSIRSWYDLYGERKFQPIRNEDLKSYRSSMYSGEQEYHPTIYDLPVQAEGDAGLFESFSGGTLSDIRLAGAQVSGTGNVGALVGSVSGNVTIEGCRVFLSEAKGHLSGKDETDLWLTGKTTGGLIGAAEGGTVKITGSFAATVLEGTAAAGGLVGRNRANLTIERSYADCYVYSNQETGKAGGLLGTRMGTSGIKIQDSYAAGFLEAKETAGLIAGELSGIEYTLSNVYSACAPLEGGSLTYGTARQTGVDGPTVSNVYYLSETENETETIGTHKSFEEWSGANLKEAAETIGTAFTDKTGDTNAYNLVEGMGLKNYSYPKLDGIPHYGDWQAKFESGALVYYEEYLNNNYGFYGANVSTLSNDGTVRGDGYGLVYAGDAPDEVTVTAGANEYTFRNTEAVSITVTDKDGKENVYSLLKLPAKFVQSVTDVPEHFYRELKADGRSYYYNPHFASTVAAEMTEAPESISVRTARQLNALSLYYDEYAKILPKGAAFLQGRGIDYAEYDWETYGLNGEEVSSQAPIGQTDASAFIHTYDGGTYPITGISFISRDGGVYAGMFGRSDGTLRGIVLTTNEPMDGDAVPTVATSGVVQLRSAYLGTLAGWNYGTVSNCAVSGYVLKGRAYSASTVYAGALVGYNSGTIRACSVVSPIIDEKSTDATLYAGGFAGGNSGQIRQSYAMGNIEIMEISGGAVTLAGFAGENYGTIRDSYCATALSSAGGTTYGFAPNSGGVSGCYYLDNGTYSFAGSVHLYDYDPGAKGAAGVTDEELAGVLLDGFDKVDEEHTRNYPNTVIKEGETAEYPYLSSVSGTDGRPVHYGDWVTKADMGTVGVIYWEQEEGGSNSGYHFSFIGFESGLDKRGSSLCTAHDDGGAVTHYGYGFYYKTDEANATMTASMADKNDRFVLGAESEAVKAELEKQVPGFTFTVYETADDGLHLESSDAANGYWTLTQEKQGEKLSYKFELCPFFGNAYTVVEKPDTGTESGGGASKKELGKDALPYEVRSLAQLQYINWSYARSRGTTGELKGSTTTYVTGQTYQYFPYLQYTTNTGSAKQTRAAAEAKRPARTWQQTHDLSGTEKENFQPIAGALYDTDGNSYDMVLYAWFGGKYDGQSYYIKNLSIDSYGYNVGVFGTTAGANIWNVVLYSDKDSVIQRRTEATDASKKGTARPEREYVTAYALGGLIGIAYDYDSTTTTTGATIENCAIAGYQIQDNSKNKLALGEAAVGGLIGVSCANLRNCSAIVDIKINCTHRAAGTNGGLNSAQWGNFIRVGGLVGGLRDKATDCYTGGSIEISKETLKEQVEAGDTDNTKFCTGSERVQVKSAENGSDPATYVYVGGIGASGFSANFKNFTGQSNTSTDGQPKFYNCYTYITLPAMEGTISGISIIGSVADRYGKHGNTQAEVKNCYYLESTRKSIDFTKASKCYSVRGRTSLYDYFNDSWFAAERQNAMLSGEMEYAKECSWGDGKKKAVIDGLTSLSYAQMASRSGGVSIRKTSSTDRATYSDFRAALGSGFNWVTIDEGGASIHGKYSFPGSDAALLGQNYPFPTVLTQNSDFGEVYLHYGSWPKVGLYWSEGIASLDLITDYDSDSGTSYLSLELLIENIDGGLSGEPVFSYTTEGIVEAKATRNAQNNFDVKLKGLKLGATEVTATLGGYTARMTVTVTADLIVTAEPWVIEKYAGEETVVTLSARDQNGGEVPDVSWDIVSSESSVASFTKPVTTTTGTAAETTTTVKNLSEGETNLMIYAIWKLDGKEYRGSTVLAVTTLASNVLGVASDGSYYEGTLNQNLNGWETDKTPARKTYDTGAPSCGSSTLFLYSRGAGIDLSDFEVTSVMAGTADALSGAGDYTALIGETVKNGEYTCLPITLYGKTAGTTLTLTLKDKNGAEYRFEDIPAAAQTSVSAVFEFPAGTTVLTKDVPYGGMPSIDETAVSSLTPPEGYRFQGELTEISSWTATPAITGAGTAVGLRRPTVFTPILVEKNATDET